MIWQVLNFLIVSLLITGIVAVGLILSQSPGKLPPGDGLDFAGILQGQGAAARDLETRRMRDGYDLQLRRYPGPGPEAPLVILLHGSGWHGLQFDTLATALSAEAEILVPDLRGHGTAPGRRGDVDYIGQLEDDIADLIAAEAGAEPGRKIVLGGHSSGGGLVLRMAGGSHGNLLDAAILLTPFMGHDAPTTRRNSGGWAQPLVRRLIGLSMLNAVGIRALNHLTVIQFRMPASVLNGPLGDTATTAYSYRLNTSYAPRRRFREDAAALPPFILIAGAADEAFEAAAYEPTLSEVTGRGDYHLVPEVGHLDIVNAPQTRRILKEFLHDL